MIKKLIFYFALCYAFTIFYTISPYSCTTFYIISPYSCTTFCIISPYSYTIFYSSVGCLGKATDWIFHQDTQLGR